MLQKAGRFLAGRFQGSKGVKKYDTWMEKNPGFRKVLGAGDLALMFYGPGMIGKGLQKVGGMGKLAGTGVGRAATTAGNFLAGTPAQMYAGPGTTGAGATKGIYGRIGQNLMGSASQPGIVPRIGDAAKAVGRAALANPEVTGAVLKSIPELSQQSAAAEQQRQMNAMLMQQTAEQQRRRQELMDILRPLFIRLQQGG